MATELAAAYVTLIPSLKGAQRQIASQLSGIDTSAVGSTLGKELSGSIGKGLDLKTIGAGFKDLGGKITGVGTKLTDNITKPALVAAGAVAGFVGALGFKRLVGLDRAQAQFRGLGYDVEKVMEQVDKGVTNTALSMADGAALAVGALATGNLPLKELEAQIKRVSNVSAAYGVEAEQAAYLLNNVLTKNKVTWGDLSQMQQNQIPIVSMLADHYGVAGDKIMKMAQDGKISIEDLNRVLDENAGAAAEEYAKSWDGIRSNIVSNIGKIGAAFLEGVFPQIKEEMAGFLERLRSPEWTDRARELGEKVSEGFEKIREKVRDLIDAWNDLDDETKDWIKKAAVIAVAAGPVLIVVGKLASGVGAVASGLGTVVGWLGKGGLGGALTRVLGPIGLAIGAFKLLYDNSEELQEAVGKLWDALKDAWEEIWPSLEPVLDALLDLFVAITPLVANLAVAFIETLLPKIEEFAEKAGPILEDIAKALGKLTSAIDTDEFESRFGTAVDIVKTVGGEMQFMFGFITDLMRGDWKGAWDDIHARAEDMAPKVESTLNKAVTGWKLAWSLGLESIKRYAREKWEEIKAIVIEKLGELKTGGEKKIDEFVTFMQGLPNRIMAFFANSGSWLLQAGRNLIDGFKRGIDERIGRIKATLEDLTSNLPSWKGPPEKDRVLLRGAGQLVIQGFVDGLESQYSAAQESLFGFTDSLVPTDSGMSASNGPATSGGRPPWIDDLIIVADQISHSMALGLNGMGTAALASATGYTDTSIDEQAVVRR